MRWPCRRAELIRKTKAEEHDSESKRLATAEGKAEQELANARLALLKARTEAEKQGIDLQADDLKRKTDEAKAAEQKRVDKAKREAKFDATYPAMKAYLVPITSPGFKQFKGTSLEMAEIKGPMSLTCLQGNVKKSEAATGYFARNLSTFWNAGMVTVHPMNLAQLRGAAFPSISAWTSRLVRGAANC